jgi:hypothetical protein
MGQLLPRGCSALGSRIAQGSAELHCSARPNRRSGASLSIAMNCAGRIPVNARKSRFHVLIVVVAGIDRHCPQAFGRLPVRQAYGSVEARDTAE